MEEYAPQLKDAKQFVFDRFPLPPGASGKIDEMFGLAFAKDSPSGYTGLVIAGFGKDEIFHASSSSGLMGYCLITLRSGSGGPKKSIRHPECARPRVCAGGMIRLFMEGVTPEYERYIEQYMADAVDDLASAMVSVLPARGAGEPIRAVQSKFLRRFRRNFANRRQERSVSPILRVVASLPKDELGQMAESLVTAVHITRSADLG